MTVLLLGLIALPLAAGLCILIVGGRLPRSAARGVALAVAGAATLCALALFPHAGARINLAGEWLPGMGPMAVELGATGLYATLLTVGAAFLALAVGRTRGTYLYSAVLVSVAAAAVAFTAAHFLLRYVALEIVALCVALAPLIEVGGDGQGRGAHLARRVYLVLRIGDAGLLVAILALYGATGTLDIDAALGTALSLAPGLLVWIAAGFALAVWVKVGGWPAHIWRRAGAQLSLPSRAWSYALLVPNLGLYLLYRTAPLLAAADPVQRTAGWVGAASAALTAFFALTQPGLRMGLIYADAALAGLALVAGSAGLGSVVWLTLVLTTPVRLLLYLTGDAPVRWARTAALALGGAALAYWGVLLTRWARAAGAPADMLFLAEAAVALLGVWAFAAARRLLQPSQAAPEAKPARPAWVRWVVLGLLGASILVGSVLLEPALAELSHVSHAALPADPAPLAVLGYAATRPAIWIVVVITIALWLLRWRPPDASAVVPEQVYDLEGALSRFAGALNRVVETGVHEGLVTLTTRAVMGSAGYALRVIEQRLLEGLLASTARSLVKGGQLAYDSVEEDGLEGALRLTARSVFALARVGQRWHTGKLRRNLLWVVLSLGAALLAVLFL